MKHSFSVYHCLRKALRKRWLADWSPDALANKVPVICSVVKWSTSLHRFSWRFFLLVSLPYFRNSDLIQEPMEGEGGGKVLRIAIGCLPISSVQPKAFVWHLMDQVAGKVRVVPTSDGISMAVFAGCICTEEIQLVPWEQNTGAQAQWQNSENGRLATLKARQIGR